MTVRAEDRSFLRRVEQAGLNASAEPQECWVDGWLLRRSAGKAKRSRCINAVAEGRLPLEERLRRCVAIYREASLPEIFRITPFSQPSGVDDFLAGAGWQRFDDTRVLVLPELTGQPLTAHREVHQTTQADYVEIVGELRGSPPAQCRAHLERLAACPVTYEGFVLRVGGKVAACGQLVLEDGLVGLYDVVTAASERGRGLARLVCMHLLATAKNRGAKAAYLQVDAGNVPALALYRKLGFREGYGYHYRSPDPSAA